MKKSTKIWIVVGVIILILILWFVGIYNGLIRLDNTVDEKWAQVENQYQRRADLIPNLIETVTGARDFEAETQTEIARLRTQAVELKQVADAGLTPAQAAELEVQLSSVKKSFLDITVERYPDLKATENFLALQSQLEGTENRVATERMRYNEIVREFNIRIKKIPHRVVASMMNLEEKEYFEIEEGIAEVPEVEF